MNPLTQYDIDKVPGLRPILKKCQDEIQTLTGIPVTVFYRIKFHHLSTEALIHITCDVCEVKWEEVISDTRKFHVILARQMYCYFAHIVQRKPLHTIGHILNRDHSSIIHNRDKVKQMLDVADELYVSPHNEIQRRIDTLIQESYNKPFEA